MRTSQGKGEGLMNVADYDKALYYTHRSQWDNLLILMVRTQDDLLSKRIEHFLHAYQFNRNDADVENVYMDSCSILTMLQKLPLLKHMLNQCTHKGKG